MNLPNKQPNGSGRFYEYVIDNIRQMIADGEDKITYYEEGNGLYYLARKHGWQ